jgi:hypothetical protein
MSGQNDNQRIVLMLFIVVILIWCYNGWRIRYVQPKPDVVHASYSGVVYSDAINLDDIKGIAVTMSKEDRERLSKFYKAFATVVQNDDSTRNWLSHSSLLKETNLRAGVMCFGKDLFGKYPGLAEEIDSHLKSSIGIDREHRKITAEERRKVVTALNELSVIFQSN